MSVCIWLQQCSQLNNGCIDCVAIFYEDSSSEIPAKRNSESSPPLKTEISSELHVLSVNAC